LVKHNSHVARKTIAFGFVHNPSPPNEKFWSIHKSTTPPSPWQK
jgi:hypothetical protein